MRRIGEQLPGDPTHCVICSLNATDIEEFVGVSRQRRRGEELEDLQAVAQQGQVKARVVRVLLRNRIEWVRNLLRVAAGELAGIA
jgi:hypothetical protein